MTGGKVRQYPNFVRLLHTSTPLRSVELSKKWRNSGFHGQGWTWLRILLTAISSQEELNSFLVIEVYLPLITIFVVCNAITKTKITANI